MYLLKSLFLFLGIQQTIGFSTSFTKRVTIHSPVSDTRIFSISSENEPENYIHHIENALICECNSNSCECKKCSDDRKQEILKNIHIFEKKNINRKETSCVLFFTGGNSVITHEVYSTFLNKLANENVSIYSIPFNYKYINELLHYLNKKYKELIPLSHSSGSISLIHKISNINFIKKAILLDPIDPRIDRLQKVSLPFLNNLMIMRAGKSYQGKYVPFIPDFLDLTEDKLILSNECIVENINNDEYGHCDLLNPLYSNMVSKYFKIICDSTQNRELYNLYGYIDWLVSQIVDYIKK